MGESSHSDFFFFGKSSQNSPKPVLIFCSTMCILSVYTLLKVVGYYDLSVLSMSVMGFQKHQIGWGVGGLSNSFLDFPIFLTLQNP